jgi:hypothetical protein
VENTTTMGCNAKKINNNKQTTNSIRWEGREMMRAMKYVEVIVNCSKVLLAA